MQIQRDELQVELNGSTSRIKRGDEKKKTTEWTGEKTHEKQNTDKQAIRLRFNSLNRHFSSSNIRQFICPHRSLFVHFSSQFPSSLKRLIRIKSDNELFAWRLCISHAFCFRNGNGKEPRNPKFSPKNKLTLSSRMPTSPLSESICLPSQDSLKTPLSDSELPCQALFRAAIPCAFVCRLPRQKQLCFRLSNDSTWAKLNRKTRIFFFSLTPKSSLSFPLLLIWGNSLLTHQ